jgi:hypothetical protein
VSFPMTEVHAPLPAFRTAIGEPIYRQDEGVSTPRSVWAGDVERGCQSPDNTWMRMRTPSPDSTYSGYRGRAPPPPAEALLDFAPPIFMQQPYLTYNPVFCFMAMSPTGHDSSCQAYGVEADAETAIGSGSSDWRSDLPSIASWSSFKGAWSSPPSSDAGVPEVETADSELICEVCEDPSEEKPAEGSDVVVAPVTAENAPSRGSIGHPFSCAAACKYIKKPRGCKDGSDCERCHLCAFRNSKHKKTAGSKEEAQTDSPPTAQVAGETELQEQVSRGKRPAAKGAPRRRKF